MSEKAEKKMMEVSAVLIEMEKIIKSQVNFSTKVCPDDPMLQMTALQLVELSLEIYKNLQLSTWSKK